MSRIPLCTVAALCAIAMFRDVGVAAEPQQFVVSAVGQQVTPARHEHGITLVSGFGDDSERYASGVERWCLGIKDCIRDTRLRGYKRLQKKHRDLLYPECPPYCSPTYGYHTTRWRQFPEHCEYMYSNEPGQVIYQSPAEAPPTMLPLTPTPEYAPSSAAPAVAPPAAEPYFPESGPIIRPADPGPAPAAPAADPTAPPAPPEPDLDPTGETFLPARPMDDAAGQATAFEEPGLLPIN
jgi:hypothetical protein